MLKNLCTLASLKLLIRVLARAQFEESLVIRQRGFGLAQLVEDNSSQKEMSRFLSVQFMQFFERAQRLRVHLSQNARSGKFAPRFG